MLESHDFYFMFYFAYLRPLVLHCSFVSILLTRVLLCIVICATHE